MPNAVSYPTPIGLVNAERRAYFAEVVPAIMDESVAVTKEAQRSAFAKLDNRDDRCALRRFLVTDRQVSPADVLTELDLKSTQDQSATELSVSKEGK